MKRFAGQLGRSLGPIIFCSLYWWTGRELAYTIGGMGMLGVSALVLLGLKSPNGQDIKGTKPTKRAY